MLGQDLTTAQGRTAVRRYVGIARVAARPRPGRRVRGLVGHAARVANLPGRDCEVLAAAILDRLALTPWADVPMRAAPPVIARRAKLAAGIYPPMPLTLGACGRGPGMLTGLPYAGLGELESADMRGHAPCQLRAGRT